MLRKSMGSISRSARSSSAWGAAWLLDGKIADGEAGVSRHFLNRGGRVNGFQNQLAFVHGEHAQRGDNVGYVTPRGDEIHLSA